MHSSSSGVVYFILFYFVLCFISPFCRSVSALSCRSPFSPCVPLHSCLLGVVRASFLARQFRHSGFCASCHVIRGVATWAVVSSPTVVVSIRLATTVSHRFLDVLGSWFGCVSLFPRVFFRYLPRIIPGFFSRLLLEASGPSLLGSPLSTWVLHLCPRSRFRASVARFAAGCLAVYRSLLPRRCMALTSPCCWVQLSLRCTVSSSSCSFLLGGCLVSLGVVPRLSLLLPLLVVSSPFAVVVSLLRGFPGLVVSGSPSFYVFSCVRIFNVLIQWYPLSVGPLRSPSVRFSASCVLAALHKRCVFSRDWPPSPSFRQYVLTCRPFRPSRLPSGR